MDHRDGMCRSDGCGRVLEFQDGPAMVAGPSCRSGLMTALGTEAPNGRVGGIGR